MGLSDNERLGGVYFALKGLAGIRQSFEKDYQIDSYTRNEYKEVFDLVDQLWHGFFGHHTNALHWFMGSSSSNTITHEPHTPWEMAICHHLEEAIRNKDEVIDLGDDSDRPFDALKHTSLASLVKEGFEGPALGYVVEVYQWVEQLIYYLRRYPDDFLEQHVEVSKITSKIMGECFRIFSNRSDIAKAYVIREMMQILYGNVYPYREEEWDVVTKFMQSDCTHHYFPRLMKKPLKELAEDHIALVKAHVKAKRKAKDQEKRHSLAYDDPEFFETRLLLMLKISRNLHEYEHVQEKLFKMLEGHKLLQKVKKEVKRLAAEFKKNKKEDREERDNNERDLSQLDAYHFDGYRMLSDFLDQEGLHPNQKRRDEMRTKSAEKKILKAAKSKTKKKAKKRTAKSRPNLTQKKREISKIRRLETRTVKELKAMAKKKGVAAWYEMRKDELVKVLLKK